MKIRSYQRTCAKVRPFDDTLTRVSSRVSAVILIFSFAPTLAFAVASAGQPKIVSHNPLRCIANDRHVAAEVTVSGAKSVRLYFRSVFNTHFYSIEMTRVGEKYRAVLPMPTTRTLEVVYFVEALDSSRRPNRTPEEPVRVASAADCSRDGVVNLFREDGDPKIVITLPFDQPDAPAVPPGFQADGIGAVADFGGGLSGRTVGVVSGAAAGAVAAGLLVGAAGAAPVLSNAHFAPDAVVCPSAVAEYPLPVTIEIPFENGREDVQVTSVTATLIVRESTDPAEIGRESTRGSLFSPSTLPNGSGILTIGTTVLCTSQGADPTKAWGGRVQVVTSEGTLQLDTVNLLRVLAAE